MGKPTLLQIPMFSSTPDLRWVDIDDYAENRDYSVRITALLIRRSSGQDIPGVLKRRFRKE
jgi:hypothetical protein